MKAYIIRSHEHRPAREYSLTEDEFDNLVNVGYDYILVVGPSYRLTSTIEDWLDYGMPDLDGDVPTVILRTSRMEKM